MLKHIRKYRDSAHHPGVGAGLLFHPRLITGAVATAGVQPRAVEPELDQ